MVHVGIGARFISPFGRTIHKRKSSYRLRPRSRVTLSDVAFSTLNLTNTGSPAVKSVLTNEYDALNPE